MIRLAFAGLLLAHGIVHVLGFLVPWQVTTSPDFPYTTSAAWGMLELGDPGARAVGIAMLGLAVAYPVAALGVWRRFGWGVPLAVGCTVVSLVACVLQSPAAVIGVALDAAILVAIALSRLGAVRMQPVIRR